MNGVSVVIPTYNRAAMLAKTVDSILAQTVPPLEVLVVNDASQDDTAQVCASYGSRIQYIRQENQGPAAARNTGIRIAAGNLLAFCDSDDLWRPDKLKVQLSALESTKADWSLTDFGLIDPDGATIPTDGSGFPHSFPVFADLGTDAREHFSEWLGPPQVSGGIQTFVGDAFGMLFEGNVGLPSTCLVRREVIDKVGLFDLAFPPAEDTEFFHRVSAVATVAIVMAQLVDYRVGHPSLVTTGDSRLSIALGLRSIEQAALLRAPLSDEEATAFRAGRCRLRSRLAYSQLSSFDRAGARTSVRALWKEAGIDARSAAIFLISFLPESILRSMHQVKRGIKSARPAKGVTP